MKKTLKSLYLTDIGNTNAKIWKDGEIDIIPLSKFSPEKWRETIYYINVNQKISRRLDLLPNWIDLSKYIKIDTDYKTLGIDRQMAISKSKNEIVVDLGSAITIDIIKNGTHLGGYILLGKEATKTAFQIKIPHLNFKNSSSKNSYKIPESSEDALYFGFFTPIISLIEVLKNRYSLEVILTGGDSYEFANMINFSTILKPNLIFDNMKCIVKNNF